MDNEETRRFEIHELMDLLKQSTSMIWAGYGAFFTVNTLLATGYGFLLGYEGRLPIHFSAILQLSISVCGVFMSYCAYSVIHMIRNVQSNIFKRGAELDQSIGSRIFEMVPGKMQRYPWGTVIGSFLFSFIWAIGAGHALSKIV